MLDSQDNGVSTVILATTETVKITLTMCNSMVQMPTVPIRESLKPRRGGDSSSPDICTEMGECHSYAQMRGSPASVDEDRCCSGNIW